MGFGYRDKVVKTFSTKRADHTFTETVGLRASRWRSQNMNSHVRNRLVKRGREFAIAIMNEETITMIGRYGLA